jgi:hypothetical protein
MAGQPLSYKERLDTVPPCIVENTHSVNRGRNMRVDQVDWSTLRFAQVPVVTPDAQLNPASATVRIPFSCHAPFRIEMRSKTGALTNEKHRHVAVEGVIVQAPYKAKLSWHPQQARASELVLDASGDEGSAHARSQHLSSGSGYVDLTIEIPAQRDVIPHAGVMTDRLLIEFINIRSGTRRTYTVLLNESP